MQKAQILYPEFSKPQNPPLAISWLSVVGYVELFLRNGCPSLRIEWKKSSLQVLFQMFQMLFFIWPLTQAQAFFICLLTQGLPVVFTCSRKINSREMGVFCFVLIRFTEIEFTESKIVPVRFAAPQILTNTVM